MPDYELDQIGMVPNPCTPEQQDRNDNACLQMFQLIQPDIQGIAPIAEDANAYVGGPQQYADDLLASISSSTIPWVEYMLNDGVEGFQLEGGFYPYLDHSNPTGWIGASAYAGDESALGVAFDDAESSPSTNGNWLVGTTGSYRITLAGVIEQSGNGTDPLFTSGRFTTSLPSAGTAHTHTVDITNVEFLLQNPTFHSIALYRKPNAGAMAAFGDEVGNPRSWTSRAVPGLGFSVVGGLIIPVSASWIVTLNANDRIAFKFSVSGGSHFLRMTLKHSAPDPILRIERLGSAVPWQNI